ncbi:tenascin-r, partial [Plakobranchus ocellatus]
METPCRFYAIDTGLSSKLIEIGTMACGAHLKLTCLMIVWCGFLLCPSASLDKSTTSTTSRLSKLVLRKTPTITRGPGMNPKVEPQEEKCYDSCPIFPFNCPKDRFCVTNKECRMVCRKPGDGQACKCDLGYEGDTCAKKECDIPCGHGVCHRLRNRHFICACESDWQGLDCDQPKCTLPCVKGSCLWRMAANATMYCNCQNPYVGELCDKIKPPLK